MRELLFLAHRTPFPPNRGDKIRAYNVLKYLSARARVHLIAFADDPRDLAHQDTLAALTASCRIVPRTKPTWRAGVEALASGRPVSVTAFADRAMRDAVAAALAAQSIDTIYCFSSQMAQLIPAGLQHRFIMDFCDVDAAKFAQYGRNTRGFRGWMMRREGRLLLAHDAGVAERANASLFVSPAEAALFKRQTGAPRVHAVANGIDTVAFKPAATFDRLVVAPDTIVFTGQMDYQPNIEAVLWFVRDILPRVRASRPGARFAIVGRSPVAAVKKLAQVLGVTVTGEVVDVRGWLAGAAVVVAPLMLARGVQNKVLEAMAMARPVVASTATAVGIDHAGTVRIGDDATEIADAIVALLNDRAAAAVLGDAARAQVVARYGWDAALAPLDALLGLSSEPAAGQRDAA